VIGAKDGGKMLEGVKIVDLTSVVFGPYATQILADMGAEVTKVESPIGDTMRYTGKPAKSRGMAPGFMMINRGKKSLSLDLKQPENRDRLYALIADADVLIHNIRGKAAKKLGIDYESTRVLRPDIIHVHCTGFGQDGPYADLQAYDDVIQAATGTTSLLSRVDGRPEARYLPSLIADKVSGLHGAYAILAAIIHKLRTGEGQAIEVPMFEAFTSFMMVEHIGGLAFDPPNAPACYFRQVDPDRQPFRTADGWISIVAYNDAAIPDVFRLLEDDAFLRDDRFATLQGRFENLHLIYRRIAEVTPRFTTAELLARCHTAQIPAQEARDIATIMEDPHLKATGFFQRQSHPTEGNWFSTRPPVKFGVAVEPASGPPPLLGEHN
jgi:crotonobetainyl-CoA:carnitine CoA-transferase CaiB-like acyl-CoA transferase